MDKLFKNIQTKSLMYESGLIDKSQYDKEISKTSKQIMKKAKSNVSYEMQEYNINALGKRRLRKNVTKKVNQVIEASKTGEDKVNIDGRHYDPAYYMDMYITNEVKQEGLLNQEINGGYFKYSTHKNPREACSVIQGKIVSFEPELSNKFVMYKGRKHWVYLLDDFGYGKASGALGVNCKHKLKEIEIEEIDE